MLFEKTVYDEKFYNERLKDFLPDTFIDVHTHVFLDRFIKPHTEINKRIVSWTTLVAKDNSIEDLFETYRIMFPDKTVRPDIFSSPDLYIDFDAANKYIEDNAKKYRLPYLLLIHPKWSAEKLERQLTDGGFYGVKVFLSYSPAYIPGSEIRIFDFMPHHQLEVLNKLGAVLMLHIPRPLRLRDPVNLAQLIEIEEKYPDIKLIVAHIGRAYCQCDVGNAFDILGKTKNMCFDFSANCNSDVMDGLIKAVGPERILFGSDLPILRMRCRRIERDGHYVNIVPEGLYGDVSGDKNMDTASGPEAEAITYFLYEEIDAFRRAAEKNGLTASEVGKVFKGNAERLFGYRA